MSASAVPHAASPTRVVMAMPRDTPVQADVPPADAQAAEQVAAMHSREVSWALFIVS